MYISRILILNFYDFIGKYFYILVFFVGKFFNSLNFNNYEVEIKFFLIFVGIIIQKWVEFYNLVFVRFFIVYMQIYIYMLFIMQDVYKYQGCFGINSVVIRVDVYVLFYDIVCVYEG